jgi:hypothetical protein
MILSSIPLSERMRLQCIVFAFGELFPFLDFAAAARLLAGEPLTLTVDATGTAPHP